MAAQNESIVRQRQHAQHVRHVGGTMRKFGQATANLMAKRGGRQRQNARFVGDNLPNHFGGVHLKRCVLLHARPIVRGNVTLRNDLILI